MADLFGVDIAGILNEAMGEGLLDGVLFQPEIGVRTAGQLSKGPDLTYTTLTFKGFAEIREYDGRDQALIGIIDAEVGILGDSISGGAVPKVGDLASIDGGRYTLRRVNGDPARAMYLCLASNLPEDLPTENKLLLEDGSSFILLESGDFLLLE